MDNEIEKTLFISNLHQPRVRDTHRPFVRRSVLGRATSSRPLRSLVVRGESQRVVAAVEDDELRLEHDVAVNLQRLARVRLDATEASWNS